MVAASVTPPPRPHSPRGSTGGPSGGAHRRPLAKIPAETFHGSGSVGSVASSAPVRRGTVQGEHARPRDKSGAPATGTASQRELRPLPHG
eukprot:2554964-Pyramimonas_sp.AAC.1